MFGIGGFELFLILLFGFLIFGPDKLPAMAKTLGKAIAKFRSAQEEMNKVIKTEVYDPSSDEPFKNPLEALSKVGESAKKLDKDEKTETFSERKARYDKERAAKKAAEEKKAASATAAASSTVAASAKPEDAGEATGEESASAVKPTPKPTPDELYGTKPAAKKAAASSDESSAAEGEKAEKVAPQKAKTAAPKKTPTAKATSSSSAAKDSKKTTVTAADKKESSSTDKKAEPSTEHSVTPVETEEKGE